MKRFLGLSLLVLAAACGSRAQNATSQSASEKSARDYSCVIIASDSSIQERPLYTESFDFPASEKSITKMVGVTSPENRVAVEIWHDADNQAGPKVGFTIMDLDTEGKAFAQVAEGTQEVQLGYSQGKTDLIQLYCHL